MAADHHAIVTRLVKTLNEKNYDLWETLVTEDYFEEYPQSGEVIRGPKNVRASVENYPQGLGRDTLDMSDARLAATDARWVRTPTFTFVRAEGTGNVGTAAFKARYPDGSTWWIVMLYELRGDRLAKATAFFAPLFEAPAWRKPYVENPSARA
jgi:SnoaL-like protein